MKIALVLEGDASNQRGDARHDSAKGGKKSTKGAASLDGALDAEASKPKGKRDVPQSTLVLTPGQKIFRNKIMRARR